MILIIPVYKHDAVVRHFIGPRIGKYQGRMGIRITVGHRDVLRLRGKVLRGLANDLLLLAVFAKIHQFNRSRIVLQILLRDFIQRIHSFRRQILRANRSRNDKIHQKNKGDDQHGKHGRIGAASEFSVLKNAHCDTS